MCFDQIHPSYFLPKHLLFVNLWQSTQENYPITVMSLKQDSKLHQNDPSLMKLKGKLLM